MLWYISKASKQKLSSLVTKSVSNSRIYSWFFYLSVLLHLSLSFLSTELGFDAREDMYRKTTNKGLICHQFSANIP